MPQKPLNEVRILEDLPGIGKSIAADLRAIKVMTPALFQEVEPLELYRRLEEVMGNRHDPCVLYVFLGARHFLDTGEAVPWWQFTVAGKQILSSI